MTKLNFDQYSRSYNEGLHKGLSLSGETSDYFAESRVIYLKEYLRNSQKEIYSIIEFGCGIGNNIRFLNQYFPNAEITGLDISEDSIDIARDKFSEKANIRFDIVTHNKNLDKADLVFINGVFHHIAIQNREENLKFVTSLLNTGGQLCLFENNPFNPGARWVMSRIPFDKDAVMINPYRLKQTITGLNYSKIELKFHFIFPNVLKFLRPIESSLINLPFGAQYCVIAVKN